VPSIERSVKQVYILSDGIYTCGVTMTVPRKAPVEGSGANLAPDGVAAVDRAVAILRCFSFGQPTRTLNDLSAQTGLYKSTILRLINSLLHARLIERLPDARYRIGPTAFEFGSIYRRNVTQADVLLPLMHELAEELGESIAFSTRSGKNERTCLLKALSPRRTIHYHVQEGDTLPCDRGSGGQILLALSGEPGEVYDEARSRLFYVSIGERDSETAGVAVPLFRTDQALVGSLTVSGPSSRFTEAFIATAAAALLRAACSATRLFGGDASNLERAREALDAQTAQQ
jgi:DNA-binding IclR family transcriptional regulator